MTESIVLIWGQIEPRDYGLAGQGFNSILWARVIGASMTDACPRLRLSPPAPASFSQSATPSSKDRTCVVF